MCSSKEKKRQVVGTALKCFQIFCIIFEFCLSLFDTVIDRNVFCSLILINLEN